MGVATATLVETFRTRDWRHFDVQLLLYVVLLITVGVVITIFYLMKAKGEDPFAPA